MIDTDTDIDVVGTTEAAFLLTYSRRSPTGERGILQSDKT